ncbi:hypothetical protein A2U01_0070716, partial [Trifolium medium]|nr:hypothetical protein [Trifolium medium]
KDTPLNGEMPKTVHLIQRDCHLPTRHMEAASLPMPSLNKHRQQVRIKERESYVGQPRQSCGLNSWFSPL